MAVYEGKWRCTFCRTVCRGRDMNCSGCGARRGADVEFFLEDDAPPVTDEALLRQANDGPDWLCETCGGSNRFSVEQCGTCGAPRGNSRVRQVTLTSSNSNPAPSNPAPGRVAASAARVPWRTPNLTLIALVVAIGGTALIALSLLMALGFANMNGDPAQKALGLKTAPQPLVAPPPRKVELAVDRVEWKRSIVIEEYRDVVSEDWAGSVPQDARILSQRQAVYSYDHVKVGSHIVQEHYTERVKVGTRTVTESYTERESNGTERYKCGTRNRGNGYFEDVYCTRPVYRTVRKTRSKEVDDYQTVPRVRDKTVDDYEDVPVYRLKITYSIKRWVNADTRVAQGADLTPRWPEVSTGRARREGQRAESYRVFLRDLQANKVYQREVSDKEFALFTAGAKCEAMINDFDQIVAFTPPTVDASK